MKNIWSSLLSQFCSVLCPGNGFVFRIERSACFLVDARVGLEIPQHVGPSKTWISFVFLGFCVSWCVQDDRAWKTVNFGPEYESWALSSCCRGSLVVRRRLLFIPVPEGVLCSLCFVYIKGMLTKLLALILNLIALFGFAAVPCCTFTLPACSSSQNYILQQCCCGQDSGIFLYCLQSLPSRLKRWR